MSSAAGRSFPKRLLRALALHAPGMSDVVRERDRLRLQRRILQEETARLRVEVGRLAGGVQKAGMWVPAGHFYSPVPSLEEVRKRAVMTFDRDVRELPGIDLHEEAQLVLLEQLKRFYPEMPFTAESQDGLRYRFENRYYSYSDAIFLYCVIRHLAPQRIIEVGSGFSSCVILDTNELFFDGAIACTFIEPYPDVLRSLLKPGDREAYELIQSPVQDVDIERFLALDAGDILFIDSTHVSKTGSDVNKLFLEVLPRLRPGVCVHVHDIFHPFEYPEGWVEAGRAWNEAYLLRAFLIGNSSFEIMLFNTFLEAFHEEWFRREMPLCLKNPGGSIWLRRR